VVLQLPAHHSERVVDDVVVDVHLGHAQGRPRGDPLLVHVVIDPDGRARRSDALLRTLITENVKLHLSVKYCVVKEVQKSYLKILLHATVN
jgi:hypothetical protein